MQPKYYTKENLSWDEVEKESNKTKSIKVILTSLIFLGALSSLVTLFAIGLSTYFLT